MNKCVTVTRELDFDFCNKLLFYVNEAAFNTGMQVRITVTATFNIEHTPATGPSFDCGGTPEEWEPELTLLTLNGIEAGIDTLQGGHIEELEEVAIDEYDG